MSGKKSFSALSDEQLVELSRQGNDEANECLLLKYKYFVRSKVRPYFLEGADSEDVMQEGMIGLYGAIRDYNPETNVPFIAFADLCVTRRLQSAVRAANRKKHIPLNEAVSLNETLSDDESVVVEDFLTDNNDVPESILLRKEEEHNFQNRLDSVLSVFERKVVTLYLDGMSYESIAKTLGKNEKSVDNALQRVKSKLKSSRD